MNASSLLPTLTSLKFVTDTFCLIVMKKT